MGYLKVAIETLRALRIAIGNGVSSGNSLVDLLARMPADYSTQRSQMLEELRSEFSRAEFTFSDEQICRAFDAIAKVRREDFVPPRIMELAYLPRPLAIGYEQTISHPHVVALMTTAVARRPALRTALDVGTGSGYQAAILSHLCVHVTSVEIIDDLSRQAAARLRALGVNNVDCISGDVCADGALGGRTFDAIIIAAGSSAVPDCLVERLSIGGRLVMPVGETRGSEQLLVLERVSADRIEQSSLGPARFVPLTGLGARNLGTASDIAAEV